MRILLSSTITTLAALALVGILFQNRWSEIASFLLIPLSIGTFLLYKKNLKIVIVAILAFLLTFFFFARSTTVPNKVSDNRNISQISSVRDNVENRLQEFQLLITSDNATQQEINQSLQSLITFAESKVDNNNPKSYQDLGKVYEAAMVLGTPGADEGAALAYNTYCEFDLENPECYATLAKFIGLDKSQRQLAASLATKAMELAKTREDVLKYNQLVEYFSE